MSSGAEKANLFPILPSAIRDSRHRSAVYRVSPINVPLGAHPVSAPPYQSQGWTISAHPEGKPYAHIKAQVGTTVVTEARIAEPGVSDQLNTWLHAIYDQITEKQVTIPETSDLFLEIHRDSGSCHYYFADHVLRTTFWLHTLNTVSGVLPHPPSNGHLQHVLQENYWIHVEMFPDTASQYSMAALNELQVIFLHARADALASETPTFPYMGNQIVEFIDLLQHNKDHASSPYVTAYVARLWATVVNFRLIIGEDRCRLSNDQSILEMPDGTLSLVLTLMSKTVLFGFPDVHRARLEGLWVDQLAYTSPWRKHVSDTVEDLKQKMTWIFTLLGLNIAMMSIPVSQAMTKGSLLLCFLGLAITFFLLQEQQNLVNTDATTAAMYLDERNTSYGFQPIAIVHSLPQTLFAWAFLLLAMQGFWITFSDLSLPLILASFLPVAAGLTVACVGIWKAVRPPQKSIKGPSLPPLIP